MIVSITIQDAKLQRVVNAFARKYNYQPLINRLPNPESKQQFAIRMMREYVRGVVAESESLDARDAVNADNAMVT